MNYLTLTESQYLGLTEAEYLHLTESAMSNIFLQYNWDIDTPGTNLTAVTPETGGLPTVDGTYNNTLIVSSTNTARQGQGGNGLYLWTQPAAKPVTLQCKLLAGSQSSNSGVVINADSNGHGYWGRYSSGQFQIYLFSPAGGGATLLGQYTANLNNGDVIRLDFDGVSAYKLYLNGILVVGPVTDTTYTTGKCGIWIGGNSIGNGVGTDIDNLYGWAYTVGYTAASPAAGTPGVASAAATVSPDASTGFNGTQTVTITSSNGSDVITPSVGSPGTGAVTVTPARNDVSFTYTVNRSTAGTSTLTFTNNFGASNPSNGSYTAAAKSGGLTSVLRLLDDDDDNDSDFL